VGGHGIYLHRGFRRSLMTAIDLHHLVVSYGYLAVFTLVGMESFGVPVPGETVLIIAGTYAGLTHHLSPFLIVGVAAAGAIIGDTIGFWIGDKGGYRLLRRYGHYIRIDEPKIKVAMLLFDEHGGKVVFFGRFVAVLRTYAAFLAGTTRMHYRRFLFYNATGGILWASVFGFGSYFFGHTLQQISGWLTIVLVGLAAAAIVVSVLVVRKKTASLIVRAEETYPGPLDN
jgi:membrane protein DedA with SNARE-associated domain